MKTIRTIPYHFYMNIDGMDIYREMLGDKFILHFKEENGKITSIHFYFDYLGNLIIDNVYKNFTNYKNYRYIKRYAENKNIINIMMQLIND